MLCSCSTTGDFDVFESSHVFEQTTEKTFGKSDMETEMRAVWISCYEFPSAKEGEEAFRTSVSEMFKNIKDFGLNTVFVHVRPFADAIYPSKIFPWSKYICDGKNPGFDPLSVMIACAKKYSLSFHAWINPFRVSLSGDVSGLNDNSPAKSILGKNTGDVAVLSNGIYFNPASTDVHSLIYNGVREILDNYDVDGIHIDDYFYPASDEKIDSLKYEQYRKSGGNKSIATWRKDSVNAFVSGLYSLVKGYGEDKIFSISPAGNPDANESVLFADVKLWVSSFGYADIVIPQLYFGFKNGTLPFEQTAELWSQLSTCDSVEIVWGLSAYKCGNEDENAGVGRYEWVENDDILSRQLSLVRKLKRYNGFALFSYSYIFQQKNNEKSKKEMQSLKSML